MDSVLVSPELAIPNCDAVESCIADTDRVADTDWTIAMSIAVDADKRRIFQALTVPEYLEAWIDMPGRVAGSRVVASPDPNGYRLDHYSAGRYAVSIIASFLFCHQRKMRLSWQKIGCESSAQSLVDFRLRGNFGSSILELRHSALPSAEEFLWYQALWQSSLAKLASLMRPA